MRKSSRKHHHHHHHQQQQQQQQQYRHSAYNYPYENSKDEQQDESNQLLKGLDVSHDALQALLNSRFKVIDLVDLLKKTYPKLLSNDQKREIKFIEQLSETNNGERLCFFLYRYIVELLYVTMNISSKEYDYDRNWRSDDI